MPTYQQYLWGKNFAESMSYLTFRFLREFRRRADLIRAKLAPAPSTDGHCEGGGNFRVIDTPV